jgi:hypothetical protein
MFDLEQAIADWRRRMLAAGIKAPALMDELESHLREEIQQQVRSGAGPEQAFEIAVQRVGRPTALREEFAKAAKGARRKRLKHAIQRFLGIPVPPPMVLTAGARETLELGGREAIGFHHDFIGTEHVLLGLLESKAGFVRGVLRKMGVDHKTVRSEIEKIVRLGSAQRTTRALPYTPRVKKALEIAGAEARAANQASVADEHVFLGLLEEGSGVAALVLKSLGVDARKTRAAVLAKMGRNHPDA